MMNRDPVQIITPLRQWWFFAGFFCVFLTLAAAIVALLYVDAVALACVVFIAMFLWSFGAARVLAPSFARGGLHLFGDSVAVRSRAGERSAPQGLAVLGRRTRGPLAWLTFTDGTAPPIVVAGTAHLAASTSVKVRFRCYVEPLSPETSQGFTTVEWDGDPATFLATIDRALANEQLEALSATDPCAMHAGPAGEQIGSEQRPVVRDLIQVVTPLRQWWSVAAFFFGTLTLSTIAVALAYIGAVTLAFVAFTALLAWVWNASRVMNFRFARSGLHLSRDSVAVHSAGGELAAPRGLARLGRRTRGPLAWLTFADGSAAPIVVTGTAHLAAAKRVKVLFRSYPEPTAPQRPSAFETVEWDGDPTTLIQTIDRTRAANQPEDKAAAEGTA